MPREGDNPMQPLNSEEGDTQGSSSGGSKSDPTREDKVQPKAGVRTTSTEGGGGEVQVDPKAEDAREDEVTPKGKG
jgi:hypothetical protein